MSDPALDRMAELVRCIVEIMGDKLIAVDPSDMRTVLKDSGGRGAMGVGEASGPNRAVEAAELAIRDLERNIGMIPRSWV
jgi:cell division GTPase FtsZ